MKRAAKEGAVDWRIVRGQRLARVRLRINGKRETFYAPPDVQTDERAEIYRKALLISLAGTLDDPRAGGLSLGAFGLTWLDERDRTHRDAGGDRQRWNAYIASTPIAAKKLSALAPADLRTWARKLSTSRSERTGEVRDRQTVRNAWTTLRAAIRAAGEAGHVEVAPLLAVELPRGTIEQEVETEESIDALSLDEIDAVLSLDLTQDQRDVLVVGLHLGPRAGELHGLDWSRLDWARREVVIARSRKMAPKNGKVGRVPLLAPAYEALRARWEREGRPASGYVWPSTKAIRGGKRVVAGCYARGYDWGWASTRERRKLTPRVLDLATSGALRIVSREADGRAVVEYPGIRARAGIERPITFNEATRHTCACHLLSGSWAPHIVPHAWSLEQVSRMLRHSSVKVTERHYARWIGRLPTGPAVGPVGPEEPTFPKPLPRIELGTYGLRNREASAEITRETADGDPRTEMLAVREHAVGVLRAIADGDRHALRRAADLATAVIDATASLLAVLGARGEKARTA